MQWLLRDRVARAVVDAELWLPVGAVPHYGVPLEELTGLPPIAEKIGVLVCDPNDASQATVLELRRLRISATALETLRLPLPELAMAIRHVNRLAEVGFHQLWLLIGLEIEGRDWSSGSDQMRAIGVLGTGLKEGPLLQLVHGSVGVALVAVPVVPGGTHPRGVPSMLVGRWPRSIPQAYRVTAMVRRFLENASA